jgi:monovalent cation:H+ antiporter, CPA1 family
MNGYTIAAIIISLAVFLGYINHRFIKMQMTIAIMSGSIIISLLMLLSKHFGYTSIADRTTVMIQSLDFRSLLLNGMLSFLLFAGAFTVDFETLKQNKWEIGTLASISTIASAFIVGILTYYLLPFLGVHLDFIYCMLFGALISPTDPIAVLATFKEVGAPKQLDVCVAGESLFNDGVGIVIFTTLIQLTGSHHDVHASGVIMLFLRQAIGGVFYGWIVAMIISRLIAHTADKKMAILLTLAMVTGSYALALWMDISGPLAMVVAGIIIGHHARSGKYGADIHEVLDIFWELIDEIMNAILFLLIGFELLTLKLFPHEIWAMLLGIPFVLLVRLITVAIPMKYFSLKKTTIPYTISILTWGGLRGGLAVALALSLPEGPERSFILGITYAIVAFAVIVQGITIGPLVRLSKNT